MLMLMAKMMMMVATRASQVEEVEADDTILVGKQPNMMMMMMCVLPETDVHFAFRCRLVPVHCMPNVYENSVEDKPLYGMSKCGAVQPEVCVFA